MAGISRRSSSASLAPPPVPSSTSLAKRPAAENAGKVSQALQQQAKKRVALRNLTNQSNVRRNPVRPTATKVKHNGKAATRVPSLKKGEDIQVSDVGFHGNPQIVSSAIKPSTQTSCMNGAHGNPQIVSSAIKPSTQTSCVDGVPAVNNGSTHGICGPLAPCSNNVPSPSESAGCSVSVDETMSTCDSMKSPDIEYIDNVDSSQVASLERQASENLSISENSDAAGHMWKRNVLVGIEALDVVDVDVDYDNPQMCAALACDIYNHLRLAETKKRPSIDFMEVIQKDINASMRAILIDWLVEVAEEYRLVPDTLYLTVNYIDRYLSGNEMDRQHLQLLGVACMLIAAKYEEICAPQVEEFCFITDNTYVKEEVLQMEATVLRYLKFEMTAPTAKCFLRRFVRAAQHSDEVPLLQLEFLANYLAELSLLEYNFLCYTSSLIAASGIFLAKFILVPTKRPWNATLRHYTLYQPSELCGCVKALHRLFCNSAGSSLPAIREKYSQHKYKFVAKKYCPPSIPSDYFQDVDG